MTTSRDQYVGQLTRPGGRPEQVELVVNKRPNIEPYEAKASIQWVNNNYDPGEVLRYADPNKVSGDDLSTAIQAAIDQNKNGGPAVLLPPEDISFATSLVLYSYVTILGQGRQSSTLTYTGSAQAFVSNTPTARTYDMVMRDFYLNDTGTGTVGLDLSSVSSSTFDNMNVNGFTTGIKVNSTTSGYAVYNRFYNVTAANATTGFHITGTSSNANTILCSRANVCTTGVLIDDSNENHVAHSQVESCTTGVKMTASTPGISPRNNIAFTRFEGNTTNINIGADVSDTALVVNNHIDGTTILSDSGLRTDTFDVQSDKTALRLVSAYAAASGTPYHLERTTNGGSNVPMVKMVDSNTGSGTPTTLQVETGRTTGHAFRILNGVGGSESFGILADGKIRTNQDTANTNTPSGATAHQLPIYNEAGTLLGYIPVYGSAW